jgi:hypothetical protein
MLATWVQAKCVDRPEVAGLRNSKPQLNDLTLYFGITTKSWETDLSGYI